MTVVIVMGFRLLRSYRLSAIARDCTCPPSPIILLRSHRVLPLFLHFLSLLPSFSSPNMVFMDGRGPSPLRPPVTPYRQEALGPIDREMHPSIHTGRVAVITGAASGIGRAAAIELAK